MSKGFLFVEMFMFLYEKAISPFLNYNPVGNSTLVMIEIHANLKYVRLPSAEIRDEVTLVIYLLDGSLSEAAITYSIRRLKVAFGM